MGYNASFCGWVNEFYAASSKEDEMRKAIGFIVAMVILGVGGLTAMAWSGVGFAVDVPKSPSHELPGFQGSDIFDPDALPVTELAEMSKPKGVIPGFPDKHQLKIIGRLVDGIVKYKQGSWWECGRLMTEEEEIQGRAMFYAYEIVRAADEVSDDGDDPQFVLNPWGLAGVIRNESQFDRCALGTHPRKRAYKIGLIKRQRRCISHTEEEILSVVQSKNMQAYYKKSGFDLGTAQLLSRFYSDPKDFKTMVSVRGSTTEAAFHMRKRGRVFKTKRPWLYWRGYRCEWYDEKVTRWAKQLGAKPGEI